MEWEGIVGRYTQSLKATRPGQASTNSVAVVPPPGTSTAEVPLTQLERGLLSEALRLLADTRARALELTTELSRRRGIAAPDVHDFQLPTIVDLQRRFCGQQSPAVE